MIPYLNSFHSIITHAHDDTANAIVRMRLKSWLLGHESDLLSQIMLRRNQLEPTIKFQKKKVVSHFLLENATKKERNGKREAQCF